MLRCAVFLALALLAGCSDESDDDIGESYVTARGVLTPFGRSDTFDITLTGNACERLGWVSVRSRDGRSVVVFNPNAPVDVGTFVMQSGPNSGPVGWLNTSAAAASVTTIRGTTLITSVTAAEVRGAVDWAASEALIDVPPNPANGEVVIRGTFRAVRIHDDSC